MKNLQTHRAFLLIITVIFWVLSTRDVSAQVIINEVYPNPNTGEDEWVELYNTTNQSIDLIDWKLWDLESSPGVAIQFDQSTILEAAGFLIVDLHNTLNNTGDTLLLKNPQDELIDTLGYTASTKGKSWARDPSNHAVLFETVPTKGEANVVPTPTPTSTPATTPNSTILSPTLSEITACPDDSAEWVELYNPHDTVLPLLGFSLR